MLKNNGVLQLIRSMARSMARSMVHVVLVFTTLISSPVLLPVYGDNGDANGSAKGTAGAKSGTVSVSNATLSFKMIARTSAQMAAFYEGRGFPAKLTHVFNETCFFTVIVKNRSQDIVWLEPDTWQVNLESGKKVTKLGQQYWRKRWQQLKLPKNSQATFRWTLLPTARDLRPDEGVGGNLVLAAVAGNIKITPVFRLGVEGYSILKLPTQTIRCGGK